MKYSKSESVNTMTAYIWMLKSPYLRLSREIESKFRMWHFEVYFSGKPTKSGTDSIQENITKKIKEDQT